ncbi:SpdA protein, partial [Streptomyces antibioticus]|uniref:SpdA protein n=1 Tax=Streptomyces antibioticus TaxID=1890 RepID=UPI00371F53EA
PAGGPRLWFLIALAASLGANIATAGLLDLDDVPASLRVVVAGWPAVAFFGGTLLAHTPRPPDAPTATATPEKDTEPVHVPAAVDAPQHDALPALVTGPDSDAEPAAIPEPVAAIPAPTPAPAVTLPPALVDRALALAEEHRATTGLAADPDAVRARLGLPPSMTASVAAHL